jgi:hypothetical protein
VKIAFTLALWTGLVTGVFIISSQLRTMDYETWLAMHHFFVIVSVIFCAFIGFRSPGLKQSFVHGGVFFLLFASLYIVSYLISTTILIDHLEWLPVCHNDYMLHGSGSVKAFLYSGDTYRSMLMIQLTAVGISTGVYAISNLSGFALRLVVGRGRGRGSS